MNDGGGGHTSLYHRIRLANTNDVYDVSEVSLGQKAFESKVYNATKTAVHVPQTIDHSDASGNIIMRDGDVLIGGFAGVTVFILDGATVTLSSVNISNGSIQSNGTTTINLDGENTIKSEWDFGICIVSGTLTIQGSGRLSATGGGGCAGIGGYDSSAHLIIKSGNITVKGGAGGAGIGSGADGYSCGNISIEGGNVVATGDDGGAGIGSGRGGSYCGNITIVDGTVEATGGNNAAGIGSGRDCGSCGDISIANTVTFVTAWRGGFDAQSIGSGANGSSCGTVTIGCTLDEDGNPVGGEVFEWGIDKSPYSYTPGI